MNIDLLAFRVISRRGKSIVRSVVTYPATFVSAFEEKARLNRRPVNLVVMGRSMDCGFIMVTSLLSGK